MRPQSSRTPVVHLRGLALLQEGSSLSDEQLLTRFAEGRDESAFEALLHRHGPLVLGVCRRALPHSHDADEVFQATFLVLARKAGSIHKGASLGAWLFGVAHRLAQRARTDAARRRKHEQARAHLHDPPACDEMTVSELQVGLDEELARLPEQYRMPLLLCYLEGKTQDEAARELGWSLGTFRRRLDRARDLLRGRLVRRGLALGTALFATALAESCSRAAVPPALVAQAVHTALTTAPNLGAVPANKAGSLACGLLHQMALARLKTGLALALSLVLLAAGTGMGVSVLRHETLAPSAPQPRNITREMPRVDLHGDLLPAGALARLGTVRFRVGDSINNAALSPDGKRLVSVGARSEIVLWDTATGKRLSIPTPPGAVDSGLAYSPDGRRVASTGRRRRVEVWDAATGKVIWSGPPAGGEMHCLAFSPDGKTLASVGVRAPVQLRDAATGKEVYTLEGTESYNLPYLAFSPDGKLLACRAEKDNAIGLRDAATGRLLHSLVGHARPASAVAFTLDGKALISGGQDATLRAWDVATGKMLWRQEGFTSVVRALAISPDGKTLAVGCLGGASTLTLHKAAGGKKIHTLTGGSDAAVSLAFTPDGQTLVAGGGVAFRLWDVATGRERGPRGAHAAMLMAVAVSPDGRLAATASHDTTVRLWDLGTSREVRTLAGHTAQVLSLAFSPDGKVLATGGGGAETRLWDVDSGVQLRRIPGLRGDGYVGALAFSPDGSRLAVGDGHLCLVRILETATGKEADRLSYTEGVHGLTYSPDGRVLAIGLSGYLRRAHDAFDNNVVLWDTTSRQVIRRMECAPVYYNSLRFSADGTMLAASSGRELRLWETASGQLLWKKVAPSFQEGINAVAFSPNGRALAGVGSAPSVRVWELATKQERISFEGERGECLGVAFTPDGQRLLSAGRDSTTLVWDLAGQAREASSVPSADALEEAWTALGSPDAARAYQAMRKLAASPQAATRLFRQRLEPWKTADPQRTASLLAELDADEFAAREQASRQLQEQGELVEAALKQARETSSSTEHRERIGRLLKRLGSWPQSIQGRQALRSLEVLEGIDTAESRQLLRELAAQTGRARLAKEARAALARLGKSSPRLE